MAGRPSDFTQAIADEICDRIAVGESLIEICESEHMPHERAVYRWLRHADHEQFRQDYTRAREQQADHEVDEIALIADDGRNDWMKRRKDDGSIDEVVDHEHIQRSRLRIDARKWRAAKMKPKVYGDRITQEQHHTFSEEMAEWLGNR